MPPSKKNKPVDPFPEKCGQCKYAHEGDDDWLCWGTPPQPTAVDGGVTFFRGAPVDPDWPICACFQPRMNA